MTVTTSDEVYGDLLDQLGKDRVILFLGAGSTASSRSKTGERGVTGPKLAAEILKKLNKGKEPGLTNVSLTEAAEYFVANDPGRRAALDNYLYERLRGLLPTIGHRIAATFPWRAVITTNYNQVVETAWSAANGRDQAAREMIVIRKDDDLNTYQEDDRNRVPLLKAHGCITVLQQPDHKMVITSKDYFESRRLRGKMYERIESLAKDNTTLFVGYSLNDYTFRNIYFQMVEKLDEFQMRSYSAALVSNPIQFKWMSKTFDENFNTTFINDTFDTFMLRLARARGTLHPELRQEIGANWARITEDAVVDGVDYAADLDPSQFSALPD